MKAGKLSSEDLERIAVLKRCGLFNGGIQDFHHEPEANGPPSASEDPIDKDCLFVHAKIAGVMNNIPGAKDLFRTFKQGCLSSEDGIQSSSSSSSMRRTSSGVIVPQGGRVIVAQPLPSAGRLCLATTNPAVQTSPLNSADHSFSKRSPSQELMDHLEHEG
jgi:hypothetical protein